MDHLFYDLRRVYRKCKGASLNTYGKISTFYDIFWNLDKLRKNDGLIGNLHFNLNQVQHRLKFSRVDDEYIFFKGGRGWLMTFALKLILCSYYNFLKTCLDQGTPFFNIKTMNNFCRYYKLTVKLNDRITAKISQFFVFTLTVIIPDVKKDIRSIRALVWLYRRKWTTNHSENMCLLMCSW